MTGVAVNVMPLPVQDGLAPVVMAMLTEGVTEFVMVILLPLLALITGVASALMILTR